MARPEIGGVVTALPTPCTPEGDLDPRGLDAVVDFQLQHGVSGLFILGTAGQGPLLDPDERRLVARRVIGQVAGRVPVVVHVGALPTRLAIDLAVDAARAGASALAAVPPGYYRPDPRTTLDYYRDLAAATDLPLFVYNNPSATGNPVGPDLLRSLAELPTLRGIKDASGGLALIGQAVALPDFTVLVANADLNLAALALGAHGSVSTISGVIPEAFVALQRAWRAGQAAEAARWQRVVTAVAQHLRTPIIGALHEGLRARGVAAGWPRRPLRGPTEAERETIHRALAEHGFLEGTGAGADRA